RSIAAGAAGPDQRHVVDAQLLVQPVPALDDAEDQQEHQGRDERRLQHGVPPLPPTARQPESHGSVVVSPAGSLYGPKGLLVVQGSKAARKMERRCWRRASRTSGARGSPPRRSSRKGTSLK